MPCSNTYRGPEFYGTQINDAMMCLTVPVPCRPRPLPIDDSPARHTLCSRCGPKWRRGRISVVTLARTGQALAAGSRARLRCDAFPGPLFLAAGSAWPEEEVMRFLDSWF